MRIEDFEPYQQARDDEAKLQKAKRLARALAQALNLHPSLAVGVLLGVSQSSAPQEALEIWVRDTLTCCEGRSERELLAELARKFETTINRAKDM